MTHPKYGGEVLLSTNDLQAYLKNLPKNILHFLEIQSHKNKFADIFLYFDESRKLVTVAPYFRRRKNQRIIVKNPIRETDPETLFVLGAAGLTNLAISKYKQIGGPLIHRYESKQKEKIVERIKYLFAATEFEGTLKQSEQDLIPGPNGLPVWVHVDLLPIIFLSSYQKGDETIKHHQHSAFLLAQDWLKDYTSHQGTLAKQEVDERW